MSEMVWKSKQVAVLYGGFSEERKVSLQTGKAVIEALKRQGYTILSIDVDRNIAATLISQCPDVVWLALHGTYGEDGCIQGLLELLSIPYTGSGVTASAIGMNKVLTKQIWLQHQLPTPKFHVCTAEQVRTQTLQALDLSEGCVLKPIAEGSSVGVALCIDDSTLHQASQTFEPKTPLLIEERIEGDELTVAVFQDRAFDPLQIVPQEQFYDYQAKYISQNTQYLCPAPQEPELLEAVQTLALHAYQAIGCRGMARVDFFVDHQKRPWLIEINTLPGMTATSLVPKMAAQAGINFESLCERILNDASIQR
ncbi:MAG: D-alanine--D-alanine ligase [Myxococcota bacterium]